MIKIVFTARTNWLSKAIRWLTKSRVSHVFIEYDSETFGGQWALEAYIPTVRSVPARVARTNVVAEFILEVPAGDAHTALRALGAYVGRKFDYKGLLKFIPILIVTRIFKAKWRHPLVSSSSQFCSELVARFFKELSLPETGEWNPEAKTPVDILLYGEKHRDLFKSAEKASE